MTTQRDMIPRVLVPVAILLFGLFLRMQGVDSTSLWNDEAHSWLQAANSFLDMLEATRQDNYPPLHNLILYFTINAFGDSELALRMPSVVLGTATIYVVYRLGRDLFGQSTGVIAALLLATSLFHIWHSIEVRMYALLCFTTVLYAWCALHARVGGNGLLALCSVCAALMLYSHVFGMFNLIAVNLAVLVQAALERGQAARSIGKWLVSQTIAVLLFLPWALILLNRLPNAEETIGWIADPSVEHVTRVFMEFLSGQASAWIIVLVACAGFFAAYALPAARNARDQAGRIATDHRFAFLLTYSLIFVPFLIALAMSFAFTSLMVPRYMMGGLPMLYILMGFGLTEAFRHPLLRALAVVVLMVPAAAHFRDLDTPDWRKQLSPEFARFEELREPGDLVAFVPFRDPTFEYYVRDREGLILEKFAWFRGQDAPTAMLNHNRVWIFALLQHRNTILPLMDQLEAAGFVEEVAAPSERWVFSLFTRPSASGTASP